MTVYNPNIGRCVADPYGNRRLQTQPPILTGNQMNDSLERSAANLANAAFRGLDCGHASDALRNLTNQILHLESMNSSMPGPGRVNAPGDDVRRRWRQQVESPAFWKKVWNRMADAYRSCNRQCFDDGVAVGTLSATAYCSASVALDGLPGPGYLEQSPLPVCETSIFAGCIQSYATTATTTAACAPYISNQFEAIFAEYQSQDCHL
jgi:hypothetical protein